MFRQFHALTRRQALLGAGAFGGASALAAAMPALADAPEGFDALVDRGLALFGVPGASVAVVENGQVVRARGYGVRRLGAAGGVDETTAFPIASLTKAFTAAAIAVLIDEGKLAWEDKVADRLPGFQLHDPVATREMTVADLLCHRSGLGLGEGDLMLFPASDITRPELVGKLRYLKPASEFRSGFAYDNVLFIVAGELIAAVSGQPWEDFVQARLLTPLGMVDSAASGGRLRGQNHVDFHARLDGTIRGTGRLQPLPVTPASDLANPAGGVWSSARDMARWMNVQLALGKTPEGRRLWSEANARRMWTPLTVVEARVEPVKPETEPHFMLTALGWAVLDYRGTPLVMHAGDLPGACCRLMLVPSRNLGLCILLNNEDETLHEALAYSILDHALGLPTRDYVGEGKAHDDARAVRMVARAQKSKLKRPANAAAPKAPLSAYAAVYRSPWYGDVRVLLDGTGLRVDFTRTPSMKGGLEPWDGEMFLTRFGDRDVENAFMTFTRDASGRIDGATMKAASPMADFSYDYQDLELKRVG